MRDDFYGNMFEDDDLDNKYMEIDSQTLFELFGEDENQTEPPTIEQDNTDTLIWEQEIEATEDEYDSIFPYYEGSKTLEELIPEEYLVEEIKDVLFPKYKDWEEINNTNNKKFKYGNYVLEYKMKQVDIYSVECRNDKFQKVPYKLLIAVNQDFISKNSHLPINDLIKALLLRIYKVEVDNLTPYRDSNPITASFVRPLEVYDERFYNLYSKFATDGVIDNTSLLEITNFIENIRKMETKIQKIDDRNTNKEYHYNLLNTRNQGLDIKLPVKYIRYFDDGELHYWDYEYIIHPLQNLDQNNKIGVNTEFIDDCDINELKLSHKIGLFNSFSPSRYELLQFDYFMVTTCLRSMIYLMRNYIHKTNNNLDIYEITQASRFQEDSRMTHATIVYKSDFIIQKTFPQVVREVFKCTPEELTSLEDIEDVISNALKLLVKDINKYSKEVNELYKTKERVNCCYIDLVRVYTQMLSIYMYLKLLEMKEEDVIKEFNRLEMVRENLRYNLFLDNLSMRGNMEDLLALSKTIKNNLNAGLFETSYFFEDFNFIEHSDDSVVNEVDIKVKNVTRQTDSDSYEDKLKEIERRLTYLDSNLGG